MSPERSKLTVATGRAADLFVPLRSGRIQCTACARRCQIGEGQIGLCGIRGVVGGKLYLLNYGRIIAGQVDPIEKKPVIHYRPGSKVFSIATTGCSWLCHPAGTKILLSDGTERRVEDVTPGTSVWSYGIEDGMRITPSVVTHLGKHQGLLWEVRYGNHAHGRLFLTAEHPVFTKDGWKTAEELQKGDFILRVWKHATEAWNRKQAERRSAGSYRCENCGEVVIGYSDWNRHRGACYTRGVPTSPEVIEERSQRMKLRNPMKDPEVARRAIQTSKERFLTDPNHGWHRNVIRLQSWLHRHPSESQPAPLPNSRFPRL